MFIHISEIFINIYPAIHTERCLALTDTSDSIPLMERDVAIIRESMTLVRYQQRLFTRARIFPRKRNAYATLNKLPSRRHDKYVLLYYLPNPYPPRTVCKKEEDMRKRIGINYFVSNFVSEREKCYRDLSTLLPHKVDKIILCKFMIFSLVNLFF